MKLLTQGVGFDPADLLKFNPAYQLGKKGGELLTGGGNGTSSDVTVPSDTVAPPPASPPPPPPMSDTTKYVLIGAGVIATGIIIYAVATAKKRR